MLNRAQGLRQAPTMASKDSESSDLNHFGTTSPESEQGTVRKGWRSLLAIPPAVLSRAVVIFGALAAIKLILLVGIRKHLQEIHWRTGDEPVGWLNVLTFCALAGVLAFTLFRLGRQCRPAGARAVRVANAVMLFFGGLMIFLAFHEGDKNYLLPIMTEALGWKDLLPYLSLNFFFRPPYLAVWIFAYAAAYYVLARSKREDQALTLTAVFAGLYWLICWRDFLFRRDDMWVVLLFGLVCLGMQSGSRRRLHPAWVLGPVAWTFLMWGVFRLALPDAGNLPPYFAMLGGCLVVLFLAATLLAKREGFLEPWARVAFFYFVAILLLASANYPKANNFNNLVGFSAKFPHYFLGELAVVGGIIVAAACFRRFRPNGSLLWVDVIGLGVISLAVVDLRLTQIMGVRLGWDVLAFGSDPKMMLRMAKPYLPALVLAIVVAGAVYAFALRAMGGWLRRGERHVADQRQGVSGWYPVGAFTMLAVLGLVITKPDNGEGQSLLRLAQSSPIWKRTMNRAPGAEDMLQTASALGMPEWGRGMASKPHRPARDLNLVIIFQESTYNQHLSLFGGTNDTQPLLSAYKDRMELFPNFFANFASSIHARFAAFTGLYPVSEFSQFTLRRVPVKSIFEVLDDQGYTCSMFYSSYYDYTGFRDFLKNRGLKEMYDADTMPGAEKAERVSWGLKEESTVTAIRQKIQKYAGAGQRFFLTYVPAAPHYPYDKIPKQFQKFKVEKYGDYSPLYLNELLYMDWAITSILDELKATGLLEKTLVVITSDHGEMLGENRGTIGHGWRVTPQLANVPLIVMDPERVGFRINEAIGSQIDLLPTILETLDIPLPPGELYQGHSLRSPATDGERRVYLNSFDEFAVLIGREFHPGSRRDDSDGRSLLPTAIQRISNVDHLTVFTETNQVRPFALSIRQFDDFQEHLLRNYGFYRDSLRAAQSAGQLHTAR